MSVVLDYIFKHGYYQDVKSTFWEAQNVYSKAYKLWKKEQTVFIGDDYESKQYVYENFLEIKSIAACIEEADEFLRKSRRAVKWLFYDTRKLRDIPTLGIAEYKFISDNANKIINYASKLQEYARIITENKEAVGRFLNHSTASHSFEEINEIVSSKDKIKEIGKVLEKAHTCKDRYPLAWKAFSKGRTMSKIPMNKLKLVETDAFARKEQFLPIFTAQENLCKLIMGTENYSQLDFTEETAVKEYNCMQYLKIQFEETSGLNEIVHIEGDELKRAILDSTRYGKEVSFVDTFTISEFYELRNEADELGLGFDSIVKRTKDNEAAIKAFKKKIKGDEVVCIQDYITASTKGTPLYNFIEVYQELKEIRNKAIQISVNYPLGYTALFDSTINLETCELLLAKRIIDSEQLIKNRDYEEIERKRKREEEERIAAQKRELENCVSNWNTIGFSLHYNYLLRYYPTTCDFDATEDEWADRWLVWNFKNTPGKTSSIQHEQALNNLLPRLTSMLRSTFGDKLQLLTLVCIPAASKVNNDARFKDFSERLSNVTGMYNAFEYIQVMEDATPKHLGGSGTPVLHFDEEFFYGKYILLFDDVITRGNSMLRFKSKLNTLGATVIAGVTIGKTVHVR